MREKECIEKIRAVYQIVVDQCNRYTNCQHCPYEKVFDDGSGACKFKLNTGYAGWELFEMFGNIANEE